MTLKLYLILAKQSFKEFVAYRGTSLLVVLFGFMFTFVELLGGQIYYSFSENIGNLTLDQYMIMILGLSCLTSTYQFLFVGAHESLADDIILGNLDYTFLRPINSYYHYALRKLDFPSLINLIIYLPTTIFLISRFSLTLTDWGFLLLFYIVGVLFIFALNQIVVEVSFFKDNLTALNGVPEYLIDSANRPMGIYPSLLRIILTYFIPVLSLSNGLIFLAVNKQEFNLGLQMLGSLFLVTILLLWFSYYLWQKGIKKYVSTS